MMPTHWSVDALTDLHRRVVPKCFPVRVLTWGIPGSQDFSSVSKATWAKEGLGPPRTGRVLMSVTGIPAAPVGGGQGQMPPREKRSMPPFHGGATEVWVLGGRWGSMTFRAQESGLWVRRGGPHGPAQAPLDEWAAPGPRHPEALPRHSEAPVGTGAPW